jgi:hypothetical protein
MLPKFGGAVLLGLTAMLASGLVSAKTTMCASEQECLTLHGPEHPIRKQFEERTTKVGIKFIRDRTRDNYAFREAYRDPSGVIWGTPILDDDGDPVEVKIAEAQMICATAGGRLPTRLEVNRLYANLGRPNRIVWSIKEYTMVPGTNLEFLPGLTSRTDFWLSFPEEKNLIVPEEKRLIVPVEKPAFPEDKYLGVFSGDNLNVYYGPTITKNSHYAVRCVAEGEAK